MDHEAGVFVEFRSEGGEHVTITIVRRQKNKRDLRFPLTLDEAVVVSGQLRKALDAIDYLEASG